MGELKDRFNDGVFVSLSIMAMLIIISIGIAFIFFLFQKIGII